MRIWASVDRYVSAKTGLHSEVDPERWSGSDQSDIRTRLREEPSLREAFLEANPDGLSAEDLNEFSKSRKAVHDRFFVERALKAGTIMVPLAGSTRVYCVSGLGCGVQDLVRRAVPVGYGAAVEATLVPFRGKIVWDGLVSVFPISFGPQLRNTYKDAYLRAKDRGEIIYSLEADAPAAPALMKTSNWLATLDSVSAQLGKLDKPRNSTETASLRLLKASVEVARSSIDSEHRATFGAAINSAGLAYNHLSRTFGRTS